MTTQEFEECAEQARESLQQWWDLETEDFDAAVTGQEEDPAGSIWGSLPAMDSKTAMKASPVLEKHFGVELDPNDIRRGGYASFEDMYDDFVHKLRERCVDSDPMHASVS